MKPFSGKVALITGGNSGLGKVTAEAFAREGAKVVIAARREVLGRECEASIRATGGEATFIRCDIHSEEQIRALVERTVETYGRLDYAYNNAWAKLTMGPIADLSTDAYDEMFTYLRGVFLCMKYEVQAMLVGGGGAIVNCSSIVASASAPPGSGHYAAAKAALEALTRAAAREYADKNIQVNSVSPGPFQTPMGDAAQAEMPPEVVQAVLSKIALRRLGRPPELAQAVLYLCSEGAGFITGTNLLVDGGWHLT